MNDIIHIRIHFTWLLYTNWAILQYLWLMIFSRQLLFILLQTHSISFHDKSWAPSLSLDLKTKNARLRNRHIICQSVQQASVPKVNVSPLNLEDAKEPPLNTYKPKEPYTATIVSVERIVGPKAPGETCHIVIDHGGNVPYWEGQSYGIIPPVSN